MPEINLLQLDEQK